MDDLTKYSTVNVGDVRQKAVSWDLYQYLYNHQAGLSADEIKNNYKNYLERLRKQPNYEGLIEGVDIEIKD